MTADSNTNDNKNLEFGSMTIANALEEIDNKKLLLPQIQRNYVWKRDKVIKLFDSLMSEYPINSLLLWEVTEKIEDYDFFRFITEHNDKDPSTNVAEKPNDFNSDFRAFKAVVDGQQRLTSLYLALGEYNKLKSNESEYELYLNLLYAPDVEGAIDDRDHINYEFKFITNKKDPQKQASDKGENMPVFWYPVKRLFQDHKTEDKIDQYLENTTYSIDKKKDNCKKLSDNSTAVSNIKRLFNILHKKQVIHYFLSKEQNSNKILDIFIRMNGQGEPLKIADLLMSFAVDNWKKAVGDSGGDSFKDSVKELIEKVSKKNFTINNTFILKASLYLCFDEFKFSLNNLQKSNVEKIRENWSDIKDSIEKCFDLLGNKLGFTEQRFKTKSIALPIIYYLYKCKKDNLNYAEQKNRDHLNEIYKWVIYSYFKEIFKKHPDEPLKKVKAVIDEYLKDFKKKDTANFPLEQIINDAYWEGRNNNFIFNESHIDSYLKLKYEYRQSQVRELLYLLRKLSNNSIPLNPGDIHIDHMHPKKAFEDEKQLEATIEGWENLQYTSKIWDTLPNLQLLSSEDNSEKNKTPLEDYVKRLKKNERLDSLRDDYIDLDKVSPKLKDFRNFYETRRANMKKELMKFFEVNTDTNVK